MADYAGAGKPRVGLLPLYLKLYDDVLPEKRPELEQFRCTITSELTKRGLDVFTAPVCRVRAEFDGAVLGIEQAGADAIVTLHLAYSPSLESVPALAATPLPIIVLDTTPTLDFGMAVDPDQIMYNHGIHGVQDMCNLLIRAGKPFQIEAGHWEKSDVLQRIADWAYAAHLVSRLRGARVGRIGEPFAGMGDFQVAPEVLKSAVGVETVPADLSALASLMPAEDAAEVDAEMAADLEEFAPDGVDPGMHRSTTRVCLAVRRWMEQEKLTAFTVNFGAIGRSSGLPTLPFFEASKAMRRGQGYAGEGDVLTAALAGAIASVYPETSFTEMFCADWAGDSVFVSHMGEINPAVTSPTAELVQKAMPWIDVDPPVLAVGSFKPGRAVFVNLAPGPEDTFTLILAPVEVLDAGAVKMPSTIRGWFRPGMPVADFLEAYSSVGGTHHAVIVYGDALDGLARFGELMEWNVVVLG